MGRLKIIMLGLGINTLMSNLGYLVRLIRD